MAKALRGMAMLDQFFHRTATRCERLRFWRDYWVRRDVLMSGTTERRLLARLAEMSIQHRSALARQRDRRLRGDGKYFAKLRLHDGWRGGVVLMLERRHLFPERHVPDQTIDEWNRICGVVIQSPQSLGIRFDRFRLIPRPPHARGKWAERLFEHTHRLRHRDIPAPLILGHLHRRRGFRLVDEYLILPSAKGEAGR